MPESRNALVVSIPELVRVPLPDLAIPNLNPQCGPRPLTDIRFHQEEDYINASAEVGMPFADAMIRPRGRPHWSLLHVALVDDDIAAATFAAVTHKMYGVTHRVVELNARIAFHREAFLRGCVMQPTRGSVEVDSFRAEWEVIPHRSRGNIRQHGIWRVSFLGIRDEEPIRIASLEGSYLRMRAVHPNVVRS